MNMLCAICADDLFKNAQSIYSTKCGHVFHQNCLMLWLRQKIVCPQCRVECTVKTVQKLYMSYDSNDPSSSKKPIKKKENSDEKVVKLQTILNDTIETTNLLALTVCNLDDKIANLHTQIEVLHGELLWIKKDLPIKKAVHCNYNYNYNENDVLGSTLARVLKTVEDSNFPTSSVHMSRQSVNFLMNQHNVNKNRCSCRKCHLSKSSK